MYQNNCKKCGSVVLYTKVKGNNTGLYCAICGAWIKWLNKDEVRAFENSKINENELVHAKVIDAELGNVGFTQIRNKLEEFIDFLDSQIDAELGRKSLGIEDSLVKCAVAQAYEKDKNALINILMGRRWNENML